MSSWIKLSLQLVQNTHKMFPGRLNVSLVTSVQLKNFAKLKVISSDDKYIVWCDWKVVSTMEMQSSKNPQLLNAFAFLLKLLTDIECICFPA